MGEKMGNGVDRSERAGQVETTQVFGKVYENRALKELAESLPIVEMPLSNVSDAVGPEHSYWIDKDGADLAPHQIIQDWDAAQQNDAWSDHVASIANANLNHPIWMTADGHVFDGVHRLTRAVIDNVATIKVRVFKEIPDSIKPTT